jgi:hypothetical protein
MKRENFVEDFLNIIPAKFGSYWQKCSLQINPHLVLIRQKKIG